ncbi:DUF6675 family protein [Treponema primitia]|uniref:DUF6675 family protein n=1 Tax=Treponema primitia TaxID=88058 RepID=UPI00025554C2|nr:DUF6675 family protein [Treponema primitia]
MSLRFKYFLSIMLFLAAAVTGSSASLEELIGAGRITELSAANPITEVQFRDPRPQLMPRDERLRRLINDATEALEPTLFVESLYRYKKPAASQKTWTEAERNALYNATLAISSLQGIEYFSVSRNRMHTFYETSTVIDGPDTKRPRPDPVYTTPPKELLIYARQKDLTFGDNIYQYTYYAYPDSLIFIQENLSSMSVGPIAVVRKNRLRSVVAVIDAGDSLLVYVASMAKAASFPGMNERVGRSFSNRAEAILSWFSKRADNALSM